MDKFGGGFGDRTHWWWALASGAQLGWGICSFMKGCAGDSHLMPFKAFAVASLFVGAGASASVAGLQASGIHKVEDLLEVGASIRTSLGIPSRPQAQNNKMDDS
ncbi:StAR lipid transfer-like protein [Quillaja saponaria]|uniref:StAR lipid transfer-like protein n=1 Tax=Quillaja saponaria TaxID=32244 RepID=A0AAD7PNT5_QUISA|nr:StAR lipid transfer-like protein [Quillaja saponaria]